MNPSAARFAIYLISAWLLVSGVVLYPGVFRITGHEVDLVQALDIAYRIREGDLPHRDFMTPLGLLAFLPITAFLNVGFGPGMSFLLAQVTVTAVLLPAIWWVGVSRLHGGVRLLWGLGMVALGLAMIFGSGTPAISASMYYNRWAWIPAGMIVLLLMLPPRPGRNSALADGVVLGLAGAALVLIKVTYVMALAPFALLVLLGWRQWGRLLVALAVFGGALAVVTLLVGGFDYWTAYIRDLLAVALDSRRQYPGVAFSDLLSNPQYLPMTILLLVSIVFWRSMGLKAEGLALLVLAPGLIYITYQNWGNDPKWLFLLAILLLAVPVRDRAFWGVSGPDFARLLAFAALLLFAPSMLNIVTSPLRHAGMTGASHTPMFTDLARADIEVNAARNFAPTMQMPMTGIAMPEGHEPDEDSGPLRVNGEELPACSMPTGVVGWTRKAVAQLGAIEEAVAQPVLVADVYDHLWLFGPFERVPGMAPWYYGTKEGFEGARYLLVPLCPISAGAARGKLEVVEDLGWTLEEVVRTDLFILFRRAG